MYADEEGFVFKYKFLNHLFNSILILLNHRAKKRLPSEGEPLATNGGGNAMKARYKE